MKNMKISAKLILSFLVVAALAAVVGVVGIVGMSQISAADTGLYENNLIAVQAMGDIQYNIAAMRVHNRNVVIYDAETDTFKNSDKALTDIMGQMQGLFDTYQATIGDDSDQQTFNRIKELYNISLVQNVIIPAVEAGRVNDNAKAQEIMDAAAADMNVLNDLLISSVQLNADMAADVVADNQALSTTMTVLMIGVLIVAVVIAMALGLYISNLISKPTKTLSDLMNDLVKTGNFRLDAADVAKVTEYGKSKDETGVTANAFNALMKMMLAKCDTLEIVADGDLTAEVEHISDQDTIGNAMQKMVDNLNKMFAEINSSSNQVSTGSVQIADGAQLLAQGATEQSATVEQLSASVTQVAAQTKDNANTAGEARDLAESIKASAEQGSQQMEQMMQAVAEINESSKSIGKVIKIIDDIAFQTNILALNAAVEAARAGQHGKGFAVVADEVRSLAAKSAEAAKNTNELIESSIQKAEQGASISAETAESLNQIVEGILKSSELVSNIAKSSNEQSTAISQIGEAIDQVSQVVQQNSATAEESAAASEEMSGQATLLQQLISQFKLKNSASSGHTPSAPAAPARISSVSSPASSGFALDGGSKY